MCAGKIIFILFFIQCATCDKKCEKTITTASGTHAPSKLCSGKLIFEDKFDILDFKKWEHENTLWGGGNWEFQWYTNNRSNSFAKNGMLNIRPTLTSDSIGEDKLSKMTLDVNGGTPADYCTNARDWGCSRTGNTQNILNPIKSARIRTVHSFSFKYGKVEVRAKLPAGDWLWPAIWMLPRDNAYGTHPASGEIDIMESRGNKNLILNDINIGSDQIGSTLHWGPDYAHNAYTKTHFVLNAAEGKKGYDMEFKKYTMEWTPDYITFKVDDVHVGTVEPNTTFWEFGEFPATGMENPWRFGSKMAPFDQEFFIIINLAVGGIGFFPDAAVNVPPKPWLNSSPKAATDFWNGRSGWLPTWKMNENEGISSSLQVDYVKVWAL